MALLSFRSFAETVSFSPKLQTETLQKSGLSDEVRLIMRKVPHPLMIVTADGDHDTRGAGMLVSSFNTITLSPIPIITFNIKLPSSTYSAIEATGHFSVLAPASIEQAKAYSKGLAAFPNTGLCEKDHNDGVFATRLRSGIVFQMQCQWLREKSVEVGDHIIMVGQVLSLQASRPEAEEPRILIYSDGQYRYAGEPVNS